MAIRAGIGRPDPHIFIIRSRYGRHVILYIVPFGYVAKTFRAIDPHVSEATRYLATRKSARGSLDAVTELPLAGGDLSERVREIDPRVVVTNHREAVLEEPFVEGYPTVHIRHGASVGRGEIANSLPELSPFDTLLSPGSRWTEVYEAELPGSIEVVEVGMPEADAFVEHHHPANDTVLYAPTNTRFGQGAYLNTAHQVLDTFEGSSYRLIFRPHPFDQRWGAPSRLTQAARRRIDSMGNVEFDDNKTPRSAMMRSSTLLSDYSGIITEWLHTDRPLVQLTAVKSGGDLPPLGYQVDRLTLEAIEDVQDGYPEPQRSTINAFVDELGIPMDGRAGERAAEALAEVEPCGR